MLPVRSRYTAPGILHPGMYFVIFGAGITQSYPTYLTVQTGTNRHITLMPEFLQYINHSCSPNVFFDTTSMQLICLQPLQPGDEFTFFYPSTEWDNGTAFCLQLRKQGLFTTDKRRLSPFCRNTVEIPLNRFYQIAGKTNAIVVTFLFKHGPI